MIATRRIAGTHAEKIEQLDEAIQELLDIKLLECAADQPNVHFLAVPRRSHWFGMTMVIAAMLALLILLLGVRPRARPDGRRKRAGASGCRCRDSGTDRHRGIQARRRLPRARGVPARLVQPAVLPRPRRRDHRSPEHGARRPGLVDRQ